MARCETSNIQLVKMYDTEKNGFIDAKHINHIFCI